MAESSLMEPQRRLGHWLLGSEESGNPTSALPSLSGHSVRKLKFVRSTFAASVGLPTCLTRLGLQGLGASDCKASNTFGTSEILKQRIAQRAICGWALRSTLELATRWCVQSSVLQSYVPRPCISTRQPSRIRFLARSKGRCCLAAMN
jgi:hypothetical protein